MKLSDILGTNPTVIIKNINIVNAEVDNEEEPVINPGIEYGKDDKAKWSPPLQQELSVMKSDVGVTPDADTTELTSQEEKEIKKERTPDQVELIKKLMGIFGD